MVGPEWRLTSGDDGAQSDPVDSRDGAIEWQRVIPKAGNLFFFSTQKNYLRLIPYRVRKMNVVYSSSWQPAVIFDVILRRDVRRKFLGRLLADNEVLLNAENI